MVKKTTKSTEFKHFDELSNEWWKTDGKFEILHSLTPKRIEYIKKMINAKNLNKIKILDLGCGGGLICEPLTRLGADVTGVDFVKKNIIEAKKHAKISNLKINYVHKNLEKFSISKKFDIILLLEVIEHMDNWNEIILKLNKILKPNGKIIISTINKNFLSNFFAIFLAENILKWIPKNTHSYNKLIKPKELKNFLNLNNYKVEDITGLVFNPFLNEWHLNKKRTAINYFCTAKKSN